MEDQKQIKIGSVTLHIEQIDECMGCPYMDVEQREFYEGRGLTLIYMKCSNYEVCSRLKKLLRQ